MMGSESRWSALAALVRDFIAPPAAGSTLSIEELRRRMHRREVPLLLLDVRTAHDYWGPAGHIAGALNISLEELEHRLPELAGGRDGTIALICTTDRRSSKAARFLVRQGFADVRVVRGGMTAWRRLGHPTEQASAEASTGGKDEYTHYSQ